MSFWKYIFCFDSDLKQRADIDRLVQRSRRHQERAHHKRLQDIKKFSKTEQRIHELEGQVGSLQMLSRCLLEILRKKPDWNEDEFKRTLNDMDMEDGIEDGK
jgi:hypothetical protein